MLPYDPAGESSIERIVDEDWGLNHHQEVADGEINHEDVWRCLQGFGTAEEGSGKSLRTIVINCDRTYEEKTQMTNPFPVNDKNVKAM